MINIHIYPSNFRNESRIEKQAQSLSKDIFEHIYLIGMGPDRSEVLSNNVSLKLFGFSNRPGIKAKLILFSFFYFKVLVFALKQKEIVVNAHSLSVLPLAYIIKTIKKSKLIYDTHELETETQSSSGLRKKVAKYVERILIKNVDHVFVVSESIADWYSENYNIKRPTVVLNAPKYIKVRKNDLFRKKFKIENDQLIVLYQGILADGRGIDILLEAFKNCLDDRIVVVFMGYGDLAHSIQSDAVTYKNIFFHNAVPPEDVLNYTASADIGVSFIQNTCLSYYYCMPNKLFEYTMAGLPVIVSDMLDMRKFVESHNIGVVVEDNSLESFINSLATILKMDSKILKDNAKEASLKYCWEHQEKKMLTVYKSMLNK